MEIAEIQVETTSSLTLPWEETIIMPIGDVQLGAEGCDEDRLKRDIQWGLAHNAYFLGMGECLDIASPSNRYRLNVANLYDSVQDALEERVKQLIRRYLRLVKGSEGRWIGMLEGHHYFQFRDGTTTDTRIAEALKSPFLGTCAFLRIGFRRKGDSQGSSGISCDIWCHHGAGSGQKLSAPLNRLENISPYFDADIYLIGHQHKKVGGVGDRLYMTRMKPYKLDHKTIIYANTGGYLRGYLQGTTQGGLSPRGGYVEQGMKAPVGLGCILLFLRPIRESKTRPARLDLNVGL